MYVGGLLNLIPVARLTRGGSKEDRGRSPCICLCFLAPRKRLEISGLCFVEERISGFFKVKRCECGLIGEGEGLWELFLSSFRGNHGDEHGRALHQEALEMVGQNSWCSFSQLLNPEPSNYFSLICSEFGKEVIFSSPQQIFTEHLALCQMWC